MLRHAVFPELLHPWPGYLAVLAVVTAGVYLTSRTIFDHIETIEARLLKQNRELREVGETARRQALVQKPDRQQCGPCRHGEFKRKHHGKRKHGEAKCPCELRRIVNSVPEKIESHAARKCMHAKFLVHDKESQQDHERDAAADRKDLKDAQPAAK